MTPEFKQAILFITVNYNLRTINKAQQHDLTDMVFVGYTFAVTNATRLSLRPNCNSYLISQILYELRVFCEWQ